MTAHSQSAEEVNALRRKVAGGDYAIDSERVASAILWKLREVGRVRRSLDATEADRSQTPPEAPR